MAIDFTTDIGRVRLLINDTNEEELEYTDEQIQAFLDMASMNLVQAAILALQSLVIKYTATSGETYRIDTIEYEESKSKANQLLSLLNSLKQSIQDGTNPMLVGVPKTFGIYQEDRRENIDRMIDGEIIPPKTFDNEYDIIRIKEQDGPYYRG